MLEVFFLGQFDVLQDGKHLNITTRNAQSLFAYLLLNSSKSHRREKLAGILWPDSSEENARSNLRHELWRLRKALEGEGEFYLISDDLTIAFNPKGEYSFDVQQFENKSLESSSVDDLITALTVYRGELLPGFYDEWVFVERTRLTAIFEIKITRLLELLEEENRWSEILDWGNRWISLGQWPEPAYRALMSAYANSGDISKAVATYERFAMGIQKEMGIKPSDQTLALYKRLKTGGMLGSTSKLSSSPIQAKTSITKKTEPASTSTIVYRSNLPKPLTSFIGRTEEIQQVERLVSTARLVTITGTGGVGKTRLAIQAAGTLAPQFNDGVCWVELSSLFEPSLPQGLRSAQVMPTTMKKSPFTIEESRDERMGVELVAQSIVKALRIPEPPGSSFLEILSDYLQEKKLLLILDNCEHVINASALLVERILGASPEVTILATSRESLGVPGEKAFYLQSLPLPERGLSSEFKDVLQSDAVRLFIDRAGDILQSYRPSVAEAYTIAQICERLDGIPLAIELAAARMNMLSTQEISARLDQRFSLLTSGRRTSLPHHQTLQAAIEWSYDLLEDSERVLFRRLSIFTDSFTLEAAEAICVSDEIRSSEVLTLLGRLVDKSLLNVGTAHQSPELSTRYYLMDTIRSFGRIKLDEAEETKWMHEQRKRFYLSLVEAAEPQLRGSKQLIWLIRLREEHNNLRSVLQWTLDTQDSETALRIVGALWRYWWMQSDHNEGREWLAKVLSLPGPQDPILRAKALNGAGILARGQGDFKNASAFLYECLEIQRSLDDIFGIANVLNSLGILAHLQGENTQAIDYYQESLVHRRAIGDNRGVAASLHNLSMIDQERGDFTQAEALLQESLSLFLEVNDLRNIAANQLSLGYIMVALGDVEKSEDYFRKSLMSLKDLGQRNDIIECLEGFAGVASLRKQPERGARLLGAAQSQRDVINIPVARYNRARFQQIVDSVTQQLNPQELELYLAQGRSMSLEEAINYALSGTE